MKFKELIDETLLLISELGIILSRLPVSFWMIVASLLLIALIVGIAKLMIFYRRNRDKTVVDWISYYQEKWHRNMFHLSRFIAPSLKSRFEHKKEKDNLIARRNKANIVEEGI